MPCLPRGNCTSTSFTYQQFAPPSIAGEAAPVKQWHCGSSLSSLDTEGLAPPAPAQAHPQQHPAAAAAMLQELASITSAEHELTAFAQRLMRRKAELIESLQRLSAAPAIPTPVPVPPSLALPRPPAPTFVSLQSIRMAMPHAELQPASASAAMLPHTGLPPATRDGAPGPSAAAAAAAGAFPPHSPPRGAAPAALSFDAKLTPPKPFPLGSPPVVPQSPAQADTCGAEAKVEHGADGGGDGGGGGGGGGAGALGGLELLSAALASAPQLPTC